MVNRYPGSNAEARFAGWDDDGGFECPEDHDERDLEVAEEDACY